MRKTTSTLLLLAAACFGCFVIASLWALQRLAAHAEEYLHRGRVEGEVRLGVWPKPRIILNNLRSNSLDPSSSILFEAPTVQLDLDLTSLRRLRVAARATIPSLRVRVHANQTGVGHDMPVALAILLLDQSLLAARATLLPPWLVELSVQSAEVVIRDVGEENDISLRLRQANLASDRMSRVVQIAGAIEPSGRPFDVTLRHEILPHRRERRILRGSVTLGEALLLDFGHAEWIVDESGTLISLHATGRLAGGQWTIATKQDEGPRQGPQLVSIDIERASLKPLVDDLWRDWYGLVSGRLGATATLRVPLGIRFSSSPPFADLQDLQIKGEVRAANVRIGQWNLGYGLLLTIFRSVEPTTSTLPDTLRAAFPELLIEARTSIGRALAQFQQNGPHWQVRDAQIHAAEFSLSGTGEWDMSTNTVDARLDFVLGEALSRAFCQHAPHLPQCLALEQGHSSTLRFPLVWSGTLGEAVPQPVSLVANGAS